MPAENRVKVWDIALRIFHWCLVLSFTFAFISGEDEESLHAALGYIVMGLLIFRLLWGFIGNKYARFRNFIYSPKTTLAYANSLAGDQHKHYLGHNPLGGWMVVLLLISLLLTVWSGLKAYAIEGKGLLATEITLVQSAVADEDNYTAGEHHVENDSEEFWEEIHEFLSHFTLILILLHIGGVVFSSWIDRENLIKAMITGYKRPPAE